MSIKIIACESMKNELMYYNDKNMDIEFIPMGLHAHPDKLHTELQSRIDKVENCSRIVLAFGLCGGALKNIKSKYPITIPKVHDCVPLFLGSREKFKEIQSSIVGTLYLSNGLMSEDSQGKLLSMLNEHNIMAEKYGEKKALKLFRRMFENYTDIRFIETEVKAAEKSIEDSKKMAELLELNYSTMKGSKDYMYSIMNGPYDDERFINIPSNTSIDEYCFFD